PQGRTPLIEATIQGNDKIVETLVTHGADVNLADKHKRTPLHWAAHKGNESLVQYLLDHKADVSARDETAATPVLLAKREEYLNVVRILEQHFCSLHKLESCGGGRIGASDATNSNSSREGSPENSKVIAKGEPNNNN